jgi:hypothetical protein
MLFPLNVEGFLPAEPVACATAIWNSDVLGLLNGLHKEQGNYYFRIECKSAFELEERSIFTKKLATELERLSGGELINSTSDYEVEIRLIANKDGEFFAALAIENVPATGNVTFIVRPYVVNTDGTETVWGDSFTLAFANGELVK